MRTGFLFWDSHLCDPWPWGERPPPSLSLWGEGGGKESNERYISVNDVPALYSGADTLLAPSMFERFGLPVREAAAWWTAVAASACDAHRKIARGAAVFVEPGDEAGWVEVIVQVASNSEVCEPLREAGHHRAREFTWVATAERILNLAREAVRRGANWSWQGGRPFVRPGWRSRVGRENAVQP